MKTPEFFNDVTPIVMQDPLSALLGTCEEGLLVYTYCDIVKLTGHSCPTVAGAYLMIQHGVKALYGDELPVRGNIILRIKGAFGEGSLGVIANVASMITGATDESGFHGLGGEFDRRGLLSYHHDIEGELQLERTDTGAYVIVNYDPSCVPPSPEMGRLMPLVLSHRADASEVKLFGTLWQERVQRLLIDHQRDPRLIQCSLPRYKGKK
jgi:hypothetical protein